MFNQDNRANINWNYYATLYIHCSVSRERYTPYTDGPLLIFSDQFGRESLTTFWHSLRQKGGVCCTQQQYNIVIKAREGVIYLENIPICVWERPRLSSLHCPRGDSASVSWREPRHNTMHAKELSSQKSTLVQSGVHYSLPGHGKTTCKRPLELLCVRLVC